MEVKQESELLKSIDELVQAKTLSGDGIKLVAKLQEHAEVLETGLEKTKKEKEEALKRNIKLEGKIEAHERTIQSQGTKINELQERVNETNALDTKRQVSEGKAATIKECFELVFRNAQVHKMVTTPVTTAPPAFDNQGNMTHPGQHLEMANQGITEETK